MNKGKKPGKLAPIPVPTTPRKRKRNTRYPGATRTEAQAEADRAIMSQFLARGMTLAEMHQRINKLREGTYTLSDRTIDKDVAKIRDQWHAATLTNITAYVNRELVLIDYLQAEALDAWDKSKAERTKAEAEKVNFQEAGRKAGERSKMTKENRDGDANFLAVAIKCHERRCRLLGIDKQFSQSSGGLDPKMGPTGVPLPLPGPQAHILEIKILSEQEADAIAASAPA